MIRIGDRIAFSRAFLRSTGQFTGWAPFARGTVDALYESRDFTIASISWDDAAEPSRVNIANLVRADRLHLEPQ